MLIQVGVKGVDLDFLPEIMWYALKVVSSIWEEQEIVIISTGEGSHLDYSKHYQNLAIDIRPSDYFTKDAELKKRLNALDYNVFIHKSHIHIEYDPK